MVCLPRSEGWLKGLGRKDAAHMLGWQGEEVSRLGMESLCMVGNMWNVSHPHCEPSAWAKGMTLHLGPALQHLWLGFVCS